MIYSISDSFNSPAIKFKEKLNAERVKRFFMLSYSNVKQGGSSLRVGRINKLLKEMPHSSIIRKLKEESFRTITILHLWIVELLLVNLRKLRIDSFE